MNRISSTTRWMLLAAVAATGLVVAALSFWWLHHEGYSLGQAVTWVLARVRGLGPVTFFTAMAILPALGVPVSVFTLTAGPVFGPVLGLPLVLLLAVLALAFNLTLTYMLARWVFRPWLERLCAWLGFSLPVVSKADQRSLVILVRVTPGPPFVLQNYLLGLAGIPFGIFFLISWGVASLYTCAFILFGDALAQGHGRGALVAVSLLVALTVGVRFLRKRMQRKKLEVAP